MAWKKIKYSENIDLKYTLLLAVFLLSNIMFISEVLFIVKMGLICFLCKLVTLFFNLEFTMKLQKYTLEDHLSWLYFKT